MVTLSASDLGVQTWTVFKSQICGLPLVPNLALITMRLRPQHTPPETINTVLGGAFISQFVTTNWIFDATDMGDYIKFTFQLINPTPFPDTDGVTIYTFPVENTLYNAVYYYGDPSIYRDVFKFMP